MQSCFETFILLLRNNPTFLMEFDLITKVALTINAESRCIWSKHTLRCHISQDLANASTQPIIQVNADPFLETVTPISLQPTDTLNEISENSTLDKTPTQLSMACRTLSSTSSKPMSCLPSSAIEVGTQVYESSIVTLSPEQSRSCHESLNSDVNGQTSLSCLDGMSHVSQVQSSDNDSLLDPQAPIFTPSQSRDIDSFQCLETGTQVLTQSYITSSTSCDMDQTPSDHVVEPMLEMSDVDDDITLLKTKFDLGGPSLETEMSINEESGLPKHVHALLVQTFEQQDFPIESSDGLKQLLFDHRETSSSDLGYCDILQHDIEIGDHTTDSSSSA